MRISDWSSDVCSSDLLHVVGKDALLVELGRFLEIRVLELHVLDQLADLVTAVRLDDRLIVVTTHGAATKLELVIPDRLGARLRNREREAELRTLHIVRAIE